MAKYSIDYTDEALDDIAKLKKTGDKSVLVKLNKLIDELFEEPRTGTGHPERLKGYSGRERWSRRINKYHRLVYDIKDDVILVLIISAYGHYDDN